MRQIIELKQKIKNRQFFLDQFNNDGERRILFVNPNRSGKQLYKSILPCIKIPQMFNVATAITSLEDYGIREQLVGYKPLLLFSPEGNNPDKFLMVKWATVIVFPFTLQPLTDVYAHIRSINPSVRILYSIDFNYELLPDGSILKPLFDDPMVFDFIEDNMYFSDTILVSNPLMQKFIITRMTELAGTKYLGVQRTAVNEIIKVNIIPFLMDDATVLDNVEYSTDDVMIFKSSKPIPELDLTIPAIPIGKHIKPKKKIAKPKITKVTKKKNKKPAKKVKK